MSFKILDIKSKKTLTVDELKELGLEVVQTKVRPIHIEHDIETDLVRDLLLYAIEYSEDLRIDNKSDLSKVIFGIADVLQHNCIELIELLCEHGDDIDNRYDLCPECKEPLRVDTDYSGIEYCGFEQSMEEYTRSCPNGCEQ